MTDASSVAADQLRSIVERIENLEASIKALNKDKSEVYGEAKANGYDVPALKKLVAERRMAPEDRAELDAILELYRNALEPRARARAA